jgi:hypothetical protein
MLGVGRELVMHSSCAATRKDGRGCTLAARPGSSYCFAHDPMLDEQRQQARVAGGQHKARAYKLQRLQPIVLGPALTHLLDSMARVERGELEPRQALALAALATAACRVFESVDVEQRLRVLEDGR